MPTIVVNARLHSYDVYIGRPSKWANPFSYLPSKFPVIRVRSRSEAVERYQEWIKTQHHLLVALSELKDKRLGCPGCDPDNQLCHGHVLAELADAI